MWVPTSMLSFLQLWCQPGCDKVPQLTSQEGWGTWPDLGVAGKQLGHNSELLRRRQGKLLVKNTVVKTATNLTMAGWSSFGFVEFQLYFLPDCEHGLICWTLCWIQLCCLPRLSSPSVGRPESDGRGCPVRKKNISWRWWWSWWWLWWWLRKGSKKNTF